MRAVERERVFGRGPRLLVCLPQASQHTLRGPDTLERDLDSVPMGTVTRGNSLRSEMGADALRTATFLECLAKINNCSIFFPPNKEPGKQLRNKWFKLPTDPIKSKAPQTLACSYNEVKLTALRLGVASAVDCPITQTNFPPLFLCIYLFILWACPTLDARVK